MARDIEDKKVYLFKNFDWMLSLFFIVLNLFLMFYETYFGSFSTNLYFVLDKIIILTFALRSVLILYGFYRLYLIFKSKTFKSVLINVLLIVFSFVGFMAQFALSLFFYTM